ncbi:MAG: hypothetical protein R2780_15125 [Crocinitomicaceae bacterium]|nr:hypothetical protein [Crocinitomicaceae bacterium]
MRNFRAYIFKSIFFVVFVIGLQSCRKKDEKYDGTYIGTERIVRADSGGTYFDSSYNQTVTVEYQSGKYTITRFFNNPDGNTYIDTRKSIKTGEGAVGFGDCTDDAQGNYSCSSSWRYFIEPDSLVISSGGSSGDTAVFNSESIIFRGKKIDL